MTTCTGMGMTLRLLAVVLACACGSAADANPARWPSDSPGMEKVAGVVRGRIAAAEGAAAALAGVRGAAAAAGSAQLVRLGLAPTAANLAAVAATGARVVRTSDTWLEVQAEATPAQIRALAGLPAVASVRAVSPPRRRVGSFSDPADSLLAADRMRTAFGVDGAGAKIGIISDSLNHTTAMAGTVTGTAPAAFLTGTALQAAGDLPASIQLVVQGSVQSWDTDEGAAMMVQAYHLAPGAAYAFATCGSSDLEMAQSVAALQAAGCTVICDDIGWLDEPMFQDGPIAQAIDNFRAAGGIYLSAAGNGSDTGVMTGYVRAGGGNDPYTDGWPSGANFHDWGIGGSKPGYLPITITPSAGSTAYLTVIVQWNQPFASNGLGTGSQADFDCYLLTSTASPSLSTTYRFVESGSTYYAIGGDYQGTTGSPSGDPVEYLASIPFTSARTVYLALDAYQGASGPSGSQLRIIMDVAYGTLDFRSPPSGYPAATIYGHPGAAGALAVAAASHATPAAVESFTSKGGQGSDGLPYYFGPTGGVLTPTQHRSKPDLTAIDGVYSPLASFNPFYGTSAAAPHAAAVAGLLRSAFPSRNGAQIAGLMTTTATDITAAPASAGADAWSGTGLVDAHGAAIAAATPQVLSITASPAATTLRAGSAAISVAFSAPVTVTGSPSLALSTTPARSATYTSGSGSSTLVFTYTVTAGDRSGGVALDVAGTDALSTAGAAIRDAGGDRARLTVATGLLSASQLVVVAGGPALSITLSPGAANTPAFTATFSFDDDVTGFDAGDITVANGVTGAVTAIDARTFTAAITASAPGTVTVSVPASAASGTGGPSLAGSATATYDITAPIVAFSAPATLASGATATVGITFDAPVTGFTGDDVTVTGGVAGTLAGSGSSYTLPVTAGGVGTLGVTVRAGTLADAAGNVLAADAATSIAVVASGSSGGGDAGGGGGGGCGAGVAGLIVLAAGLAARSRRRT